MSIYKALVILALLTPACASATDYSGKWSGSSPDNSSMRTIYAVLQQEGAKLTGTAGPGQSRQFPIAAGKVDGEHVTFEVHMGGGTIRFDLTSIASELRGTTHLVDEDGHTDKANVVFKLTPSERPV